MAEKEDWRLCVDWLVRCSIIQQDHRVNTPAAQVFDLASVLRDGVLLCHLLNQLHSGAIDLKDFSQRPQMSQFLCLKNIRAFLNTCRKTFGLAEPMFEPYDLFEVRDFGKVIKTLSLLSKSPKAKESGITGFQECNPIYSKLPEIADNANLEELDDDNYSLYDHVGSQADEDDIYQDLCALRRRSSSVAHVSGEPRSKRDFCIKELEDTEQNYVEALDMILTHFVTPLRNCLSQDDHRVMFMSLEQLATTHGDFLAALKQATGTTAVKASHKRTIPDCFMQWKEKFLVYGDFCSNLPKAQERVDELCTKSEALREKINECQRQANNGKFRLRDLLSVPMQRVLKYHLLLTELIKQTDRTHPDRKALDRALEEMKDLSLYVNEVKRDNEALQLIEEIQNSITDLQMPDNTSLKDYGKLLKDGELKIKSHEDNKARTRYIFLFDKVMLMCKSRGETYGYKHALILSQYRVEDPPNPRPARPLDKAWSYTFLLAEKNSQSAFTIAAKTEDMKRKWIEAITMAHDNTTPKGAREGQHEFIMYSFPDPTICDVCRKLLRGVFYQGYKCQATNMSVHKECILKAKNMAGPPTGMLPERQFPPPAILNRGHSRTREILGNVKAKVEHTGSQTALTNRNMLKFKEGAVIQLLNSDDPVWWEGRFNGMEGFFPASVVEEMRAVKRRPSYTEPTLQVRRAGMSPQQPTSPGRHRTSSAATLPRSPGIPLVGGAAAENYVNGGVINDIQMQAEMANKPWFVGEMRRDVASLRLDPMPDSTFLVRESINPNCKGEYALSIKFAKTVKHIRIFRSTEQMFYLADCKLFRSVPELVQYYQENTLQNSFPELQTSLLYPFRDSSAAQAPPPTLPPPPAVTSPSNTQGIGTCNVLFDYTANQLNQLTLELGDRVTIISKAGGDRGWWKGMLRGKVGYFPSAYVEED